ncbi:MAG TPA: hypothetical protein VMX96_05440 [Dehalococcoidia bacterium]|nr:hypothetical protein [Dehalococcoidia bacterium]
MVREWWYWRKYHPIYYVSMGSITQHKINGGYKLTIPVSMDVTNKDTMNSIMLTFTDAHAIAHIKNVFGRKIPCPFEWSGGFNIKWLEPMEESKDEIHFTLSYNLTTSPKTNQIVLCEFSQLATVSMKGARPIGWKRLRLKIIPEDEPSNAQLFE